MKTNELTGAALDWAVAKCEGKVNAGPYGEPWVHEGKLHLHYCDKILLSSYDPSTDWELGGPIIERERIATRENADSPDWYACKRWDSHGVFGPTPLIAAMRCYVASKLGAEVEVPDELA